jgi:hypothetical protein
MSHKISKAVGVGAGFVILVLALWLSGAGR